MSELWRCLSLPHSQRLEFSLCLVFVVVFGFVVIFVFHPCLLSIYRCLWLLFLSLRIPCFSSSFFCVFVYVLFGLCLCLSVRFLIILSVRVTVRVMVGVMVMVRVGVMPGALFMDIVTVTVRIIALGL